jgi:hypothetical protein
MLTRDPRKQKNSCTLILTEAGMRALLRHFPPDGERSIAPALPAIVRFGMLVPVAAWNSLDEDVKRAFWRDCVQSNPVGYQPPKQTAAVLNSVPDDLGRTATMPDHLKRLRQPSLIGTEGGQNQVAFYQDFSKA